MSQRPFIRHIVFFSASDKADVPRIMEGLSLLGDIPHSSAFEVARNHAFDDLSKEVDVVVYAEFETRQALDAFKAHPRYQQSIDAVRPLRDLRIVADL